MQREYQQNDIERCGDALTRTPSIVYQLPTGGGKTHMFSEISYRFISKNTTSVVIVVHRVELLQNTRRHLFEEHDIIACEIKAGMKDIPPARVYVCMVESLNKRLDKLKNIGLLILDECHIAVHNKIIDKLNVPFRIGFTASPLATNKKQPLNRRYLDIVVGPQISELIRLKYLCQNITYAPRTGVNRNNLVVRGDDFDENEMGREFSKALNVVNTVNAYRRWGLHTKTMIFNVNVAHSKTVLNHLLAEGFNAQHIDAETPMDERQKILRWFKKTPDAILCNVGLFTTGYDEPTIETIIVNRATNSLGLWLQMCGRGSRTIDGALAKKLGTYEKFLFKIIDMGQNAITHGDWCDDRNWEFIFRYPPTKSSKLGVAPSKECPMCEAILPAQAMSCRYCNFMFPPRIPPTEELMNAYVIMTRNIDVEALIAEHENKKQYHVFYKVIRAHVNIFKRNPITPMTNEIFDVIKERCFKDCKRWCNLHKKRFNKWHQNLCFIELQKELKYEYRLLQENHKSRA